MDTIDFIALGGPLSEDDSCGPDLDLAYDDEYLNFVANLEGLLPTSFFNEGRPFSFDPTTIKVDEQIAGVLALLNRSRDLRLLALLARLFILNRDLRSFASAVEAIATLTQSFWLDVHPRAEDGSLAMRSAALNTLDETTVVFSLQYSRLCEGHRSGPITFRSHLYATREVEPRDGEETPSESTISQALRDGREQSLATRASLEMLRNALNRIRMIWLEHADPIGAPSLTNVSAVAARMIALIDLALPNEATPDKTVDQDGAEAAPEKPLALRSIQDAAAALSAANRYFATREPSSPVLPLIGQAHELIGKSFIEALQILLPDYVSSAAFQIGTSRFFPLPVERLSSIVPTTETNAGEDSSLSTEAGVDDESISDALDGDDMAREPAIALNGNGADHGSPANGAFQNAFKATTRREALGLLKDVSAWMRAEEPSSPAPWLIDRACALADRDFLSVLRAVLPAEALRDIVEGTE